MILCRVLLLILILVQGNDVFSAFSIPIHQTDSILIATNGKKTFKYKLGKFLLIKHKNLSDKISGQLYEVTSDSVLIITDPDEFIYMKHYKAEHYSVSKIAIKDIHSISILHKKERKNWEKSLMTFAILTGLGLLLIDRLVSIGLLLLVPSILGIYYLIPFLLISFLSDFLSTKSIKKGWDFHSKKNEMK